MEMSDWKVLKFNNILSADLLYEKVTSERGKITYNKYGTIINKDGETQVSGSLSRYNHPRYKFAHYFFKNYIESIIKEKIYPSYYYDRFYFSGQELVKHVDRGACEISLSFHISSNLNYKWPLHFQYDDKQLSVECDPGDGVLYKGCEVPHWRDPMVGDENSYFHQIFFHYVKANGHYLQYAYDSGTDVN